MTQNHRSRTSLCTRLLACLSLSALLLSTTILTGPASAAPQEAAATNTGNLIVAKVNGERITRDELAKECLRHYGAESLDRFVSKYLIIQECQKRGVTISQQEIDAKIQGLATSVKLQVGELLQTLQDERGINPQEYADEIIWPMIALKKLAGQSLQITEEELKYEYEKQYGSSVQVQMIACETETKALEVLGRVLADPANFGNVAKNESIDTASACVKGLMQPIRRHVGDPAMEQAAFALSPNQISEVIPTAGQFVLLKCVRHLPGRGVAFEDVRQFLTDRVEEQKANTVGKAIFRQLQDNAKVVNVMADPEASAKMPGVAALINGQPILLGDLAEMCLQRHGQQVLEGYIGRRLLEQACRDRKIVVTDQELDAEIARAASLMLRPLPDGQPDSQGLIELMIRQQGITEEVYRSDSVWPSVALKKLVDGTIQLADADIQRGFESNYGPRVRCLAIALTEMRRAQQVWEMAMHNKTEKYFGDLAAEYSTDGATAALRGEIPPIQRHGGQPVLEAEAFSLNPGEISSIVQVGPEQFAILMCLGKTDPVDVELADVREYIIEELREKKLRIAMAQKLQKLQQGAMIENFLQPHQQATRVPVGTSTE